MQVHFGGWVEVLHFFPAQPCGRRVTAACIDTRKIPAFAHSSTLVDSTSRDLLGHGDALSFAMKEVTMYVTSDAKVRRVVHEWTSKIRSLRLDYVGDLAVLLCGYRSGERGQGEFPVRLNRSWRGKS